MGRATEWLAEHLGAAAGGLLNATFGNAAELIIAIMGLRAGLLGVVKASITGSIIGNILLVLGVSIIAGGLKRRELTFNRTAASLSTTLLALSAIALVVPALFHQIARGVNRVPIDRTLSLEISIVLSVTYVLNLLFSLRSHKHLYEGGGEESDAALAHRPIWLAISVLVGATALVALLSEFLVGAIEPAAKHLGMSEVFVGVFVLAIVGNAAEHSTAVLMAMKNKMDLAFNIAA